MSAQLEIPFETLVTLVEQLPEEQQRALLTRLLEKAQTRQSDVERRMAAFDSMVIDLGPVSPAYSDRREDWYDDGR